MCYNIFRKTKEEKKGRPCLVPNLTNFLRAVYPNISSGKGEKIGC
nr:MAG TPA: hypothetical protein [Caudoviricetes sp.]